MSSFISKMAFASIGLLCLVSCRGNRSTESTIEENNPCLTENRDGDDFVAKTDEGVDMSFKIISAARKTVQVGLGDDNNACIDSSYSGQITIPEYINGYKVVSIAENSFSRTNISSVIIPEGVKSIKEYAFCRCYNLKRVHLPMSLCKIENRAFANTAIEDMYIPKSVSFIGEAAITPNKIKTIRVDANNEFFDSRDNCNAIIETLSNKLVLGCSNTSFPETVEIIGDWAFCLCEDLTKVDIPANVKNIGKSAFHGCENLTIVTLHDGLESIGEFAFYHTGLDSVVVPKTVYEIGQYAFEGCNIEKMLK